MSTRSEELTPTALQTMTNTMLSEDFDKADVTKFFGVLVAMDESEQEVIEITAYIGTGKAYNASRNPEASP